jgi:hypothetical protein
MTLDAISIVFGQMSGILCTQSSSRIVNWCIEHYHNIFEVILLNLFIDIASYNQVFQKL